MGLDRKVVKEGKASAYLRMKGADEARVRRPLAVGPRPALPRQAAAADGAAEDRGRAPGRRPVDAHRRQGGDPRARQHGRPPTHRRQGLAKGGNRPRRPGEGHRHRLRPDPGRRRQGLDRRLQARGRSARTSEPTAEPRGAAARGRRTRPASPRSRSTSASRRARRPSRRPEPLTRDEAAWLEGGRPLRHRGAGQGLHRPEAVQGDRRRRPDRRRSARRRTAPASSSR